MTKKIITTDAELATALKAANPGDTLELAGVFRKPVYMDRGGEPDKPLKIISAPDTWAVFDFSSQTSQFIVAAEHVVVEKLQFQNGSMVRSMPEGHCTVWRNCRITAMYHQGLSLMGPDSLIEDCNIWLCGNGVIDGNDNHSLYLAGARQVARRNILGPCIFGSAVTMGGGADKVQITDNMIYSAHGWYGTAVNIYGERHLFARNTVYHSGFGKGAVECYAGPRSNRVQDNTIYSSDLALCMYRPVSDDTPPPNAPPDWKPPASNSIASGNTIYGRFAGADGIANNFPTDNTIQPAKHCWLSWGVK